MLSEDERELMEEALVKLEAEKTRRARAVDRPYFLHEVPGRGMARVFTGVPRTQAEGEWLEKNRPVPTAPAVPEVSGADELVRPQHGIAASQIMDSLPSGPTQAPTDWTVNFRAPNGPSGRVRVEVDPGDGAADCGVIAEADWSVHGDELVLKIGNTPASAHPLMGRSPIDVAKKALRERLKETAFNRPLQYPTIGIV